MDQLARITINAIADASDSPFGLPSERTAQAIADARAQFKVGSSRQLRGARLDDEATHANVVLPSRTYVARDGNTAIPMGTVRFPLVADVVTSGTRWRRARVLYVFSHITDPALAVVVTRGRGTPDGASLVLVEQSADDRSPWEIAAVNGPVVARLSGIRLPAAFVDRDGEELRLFESARSVRRATVADTSRLVDWFFLAVALWAIWMVWALQRGHRVSVELVVRTFAAWVVSAVVAVATSGLLPPIFGPHDLLTLMPWLVAAGLGFNVIVRFSGGSTAAAYRIVQRSMRRLDNDRLRLGRDLHDHGQPRLSQAASQLASLAPGADATTVLSLLARAQSTMSALRASLSVRPSSTRALRTAIHELGADLAMDVRVHGRTGPLPGPARELAHAVIVEAIANAHKHARAQLVTVRFMRRSRRLALSIEDDGGGMAAATAADASGLAGLRDRIEQADGELTIENRAGSGVTVEARLPIGIVRVVRDALRALGWRPLANAATAGLLAAWAWNAGGLFGQYATPAAQIAVGTLIVVVWIALVFVAIANSETTRRRLGWALRSQNIVANAVLSTVMGNNAAERRRLHQLIQEIEHTIAELAVGADLLVRPRSRVSDTEVAEARASLVVSARDVIARVRALARETYPPYLQGDGFVAALHELADRAAIPVAVRGTSAGTADQTVALSIYRLVDAAIGDATRLEHRDATLTLDERDSIAKVQLIARGGNPAEPVPLYARRWASVDDYLRDGLTTVDTEWELDAAAARILALNGTITVSCAESLLSVVASLPTTIDDDAAHDYPDALGRDSERAARILVIHEDMAVRERIRSCLTKNGQEIAGEAWDADQGVQVARLLQPDVVVLSPECGELVAARLAAALAPGSPIIRGDAATANDCDELLAAVAGAVDQRDAFAPTLGPAT